MKKHLLLALLAIHISATFSQVNLGGIEIDYANPKEYFIGGITTSGAASFDSKTLILLSGLGVGDKVQVPGDKFGDAIKNLWKQGLFNDVSIHVTRIEGSSIFIDIHLAERPRLSKFTFRGVRHSDEDELREKMNLVKGKVLTEHLLANARNIIKEYYSDKGFLNASVEFKQDRDSTQSNSNILYIIVNKGKKVKIEEIVVHGNHEFSAGKIKRQMKDTRERKWWDVFHSAKYLEDNFDKDMPKILEKYRKKGFRDARIARDTVYKISEDRVRIELVIDEGKKYYFRNITFVGNSKYTSKQLYAVLGIKKGDIYNQDNLDTKLFMNPNGNDVSSLYMDDGYLFFQVTPTEVMVEGDSIDLEIRIYEGKQAIINRVTVVGNTKTNDHVIMREIRTKPGQLFSRSDIIRTQRELAQLGYFDAEKLGVNPTPNPAEGTVDIEYVVEEKPSDQVELSGGWGGGRVVGTLGVTFNNFSARNINKKGAWRPLPSGDGQRISVRAQSTGPWFQSYNMSFTEPWLGGRKPTSLSISAYHSIQSNGQKINSKVNGEKVPNPLRQSIDITGVSVGIGARLKKPDDFFSIYEENTFQHYRLNNYQSFFSFNNGYANNLSFKLSVSRNSIDRRLEQFPTSGSDISISTQITPPYSYFNNKNYADISDQERYRWVEYHKEKITLTWFTRLTNKRSENEGTARNLVLFTKAGFGLLGVWNPKVGLSPFERFYLGGSGLSGFNLDGREIIALRGYDDQALSPRTGAAAVAKYTMELRYPIVLGQQATIWALGFAEAGNSWSTIKKFDPFTVKKSMGAGVRLFLPMFGLLGFDYGWGFDEVPGLPNTGRNPSTGKVQGQFHFTIGAMIGEL